MSKMENTHHRGCSIGARPPVAEISPSKTHFSQVIPKKEKERKAALVR